MPSAASLGGGTDRGQMIAIPGEGIEDYSYRTGSGKVKPMWTPHGLLKGYTTSKGKFRKARRAGRKGSTAFIVRGRGSSVPMIVRRRSVSRYPLEVLYILRRMSRYKATWDLIDTVERYVIFAFPKKFEREMNRAIKSAF